MSAVKANPMMKVFLQDTLMDLSNGIITPMDKEVLAYTPLSNISIDPYASKSIELKSAMELTCNSLTVWIDEAKKASYFTSHFVTLSKMIRNGVASMARGLMTLHVNGEALDQSPMSVEDLIGVSSYHIRKSYLGVLQTSRSHPEIGEQLLLNQLGWTNTLMRLFKTKEKLSEKIKIRTQKFEAVDACRVQDPDDGKIEPAVSEIKDEKNDAQLPAGNDANSALTVDSDIYDLDRPVEPCELFDCGQTEAIEPFDSASSKSASGGLTAYSAFTEPAAYSAPRAFSAYGPKSGKKEKRSSVKNIKTAAVDSNPVLSTSKDQPKLPEPEMNQPDESESSTEMSQTETPETVAETKQTADPAAAKSSQTEKAEPGKTCQTEDGNNAPEQDDTPVMIESIFNSLPYGYFFRSPDYQNSS